MKSPITGNEMVLMNELRTLIFRKEEFEIHYHFLFCNDSKESFTSTELDELNINQLYNAYRSKYNLPFPDEILNIRKKYGLSSTKMSEVLGFGVNSYRNYESGEVPSLSNARLIQLADNPCEFKDLVVYSNIFKGKSFDTLLSKLETLIESQYDFKKQLESYFIGYTMPNEFTGYRVPNIDKFKEMIIFFTERLKPWKTKLNKLLFYSDFENYRRTGFSMSGMQYKAIPLGPVPNNFQGIYEYFANNDDFDIIETTFSDGHCGEQFMPNSSKNTFNYSLFSTAELAVLEGIASKFKHTSIKDIIELSHKEKGWLDNQAEKKSIDYKYSFELL